MNPFYREQVEHFTAYIKENSNEAYGYLQRGALHDEFKQFQLAIDDYTSALNIIGPDDSLLISRGKAHQSMGNENLALQDFDAALAIPAADSDPHYRLSRGLLEFERGMYEEAMESAMARLWTDSGAVDAHMLAARCHAALGSLPMAIGQLDNVIGHADPSDQIDLYEMRARFYEQAGDKISADLDWKKWRKLKEEY